jgi:hypothetical protein
MVATDEDTAWATAFWFWKTNVGKLEDVKNGRFGASTKAINGALECYPGGTNVDAAKKRYNIYKKILIAFGVSEAPVENGCYN